MKKDFYIFRHGETDYNIEQRWQGQNCDTELNSNGLEQAKELANKLLGKDIEVVFSSPLKRAHKTAEVVANKLGVQVSVIDGFKEGCFGVAEGLKREEFEKMYKKQHDEWMNDNNIDCCFEGGETKRQIGDRVFSALNSLLEKEHSKMAVATHGGAIYHLLRVLDIKVEKIPNVGVFHIRYDKGVWKVI